MTIDYYAILGVLPSAEDVVIRAAYRALANRYHPDKFEGSADEATRRMQEINIAYAILSDAIKRSEYDKARGAGSQDGDPYFGGGSDDQPPHYDPLEAEWAVAVKYYPDIVELEARLSKIAWRLGYSYRAFLIAEKAFGARASVADTLERQFLQSYFGTNPQILQFALSLVRSGQKKAAKALNEAVRVFGNGIESSRVIRQIKDQYSCEDVIKRQGASYIAPPVRGMILILSGGNAGKEIELTKTLTTVGKPGDQVAVIARRPHAYYITYVEGANYPLVNGKSLDARAHQLADRDVIQLAGVMMEFKLID
jgi:curved DNA-binding protein CbpA